MNYLLIKADGKLYCADIPEEPEARNGHEDDSRWLRDKALHREARDEAIANALPVINWHMIGWLEEGQFFVNVWMRGGSMPQTMEPNVVYPWNGGAEIEDEPNIIAPDPHQKFETVCKQKVVRLSLFDNKPKTQKL